MLVQLRLQQLVQAQANNNVKALHHCPFVGESTNDRVSIYDVIII